MKKVISMTVIASLVLSSASVYASEAVIEGGKRVDVVAAATGTTTPAPTTPKPSTPKPSTPKPSTPKPSTPKPSTPKPSTPAPSTPKPTTPSTTTPSTSVKLTRVLKVGSRGADVKELQTLLNSNGSKLKIDGVFGTATKIALKDYQSKNGLKADGVYGQKSFEKLNPKVATPATPAKPDVVTTASLVNTEAAFEKGISKDGKWIVTTLKDLTFTKELVLDGEFKNGKKNPDGTDAIQRKIGLYTQDAKKNVTARFTLTAPKLTILSPNARIQSGTFKGDIYVRVANFQLVDAKVDGNIYFVTQEAKDTFKMDDKSSVTGSQILADIDAATSASLSHDIAAFEKSLSASGTWIVCPLRDLTTDKELVVEGTFYDKNDTTKALKRKIGLYTHNDPTDKKKATHSFTLTAPKLTVKSPSTTLQYGTFVGDIYVYSNNFNLTNNTVKGNIYFATQSAKDTFTMTNSTVTGNMILADIDAVTTASIVNNIDALEAAMSSTGSWIPCITRDITTDKALVLDGEFKNTKGTVIRKLALYTQDDKKVTTRKFTLTAPKLTVNSPNANITKGTFKGDVYVTAANFKLIDAVVDGNIYFTNQAAKDTFTMDATSKVTGAKILADVDAVTTASVVDNVAALEKAMSANGTWIPAIVRDLTTDKELVLDGTFKNGKKDANGNEVIARKLALYTQAKDASGKNVTTRVLTLTAPKLTIKSPNANISKGIFKGDLYVSATGFQLIGTKVDGNIYFMNDEARSTFKMDATSSVTGVIMNK